MVFAYLLISLIGVVLWMPIMFRFYRAWTARRNPVSLSICAAIAFIMWTTMAGMWLVTGKIEYETLIVATSVMSLAVATYVHVAFYWSKLRFPESRTPPPKES